MFESELEGRLAAVLHAVELDAARFHAPSVEEVIALGESAPMTAQVMAQLDAIDPATLTADQLVGWAVGCQRAANHWDAQRARAVAATVAACPDDPQVPRELHGASQLGAALGIGSGAADCLVAESTQLVEVLPDALAMAVAGDLSWRKASSLASNTLGMAADKARQVAGKVLPKSWDRPRLRMTRRCAARSTRSTRSTPTGNAKTGNVTSASPSSITAPASVNCPRAWPVKTST
jgi:hypothetical protein